MSIKENLDQLMLKVQGEHPLTTTGDRIMGEALLALFAGVHSTEWKNLMKNFAAADKPEQLARLTFNDSRAADPDVRVNALHLAAVAACGATTITESAKYVKPELLDKTLACEQAPGPADADAAGGSGGGSEA